MITWQGHWQEMLALILSLPEAQIVQVPPQGGWSVQQVVQHLYLSEKASLEAVDRRLSKPETVRSATMVTFFRSLALNGALASPLKFKAPPAAGADAFENESWPATLQKLTDLHAAIPQRIVTIPPDMLRKTLYTHPRAGRLTLRAMFRFFGWHVWHHKRQVDRILHQLTSPTVA